MPGWSARVFFFIVFGFAIYVIARGDGPAWKKIFTQSMGKSGGSGSGTASNNPATNQSLASQGNAAAQQITGTTPGTNQMGSNLNTLVSTGQTGIDSGSWDDGVQTALGGSSGIDTGGWD